MTVDVTLCGVVEGRVNLMMTQQSLIDQIANNAEINARLPNLLKRINHVTV